MTQQTRCGVFSGNRTRMRAWGASLALIALGAGSPAGATDLTPSLAAQLGGKTLSAVAYVPRLPAAGGGALRRIVLQAYLAPDGRSLVRQWIASHNRYSAPVPARWSLTDSRLCIDLPAADLPALDPLRSDPRKLCADVHIWGPRIAGIGTQPYAMLDGDIRPGNTISGAR